LKVLVTGSAGLIGQQVVKDLSKLNEVFSSYNDSMPEYGEPVRMDLRDHKEISSVFDRKNPDVVIHLGAMTDVDLCESENHSATEINAKSTETIAKECSKQNSFLIYLSTDYVFDGNSGMYKETDTTNPIGYYGKSKLDGEISVQNSSAEYCIARTSTPFGLHSKKKSFPIWIIENLKQKNQINVLTDQITSPTYIPNLSKMLIEIAERKITGILHVSGASNMSRYDMACMIADKLNFDQSFLNPATMNEMNWIAKRPKNSSLDVSKAGSILNEKPQTIEESIEMFTNTIKSTN
jgi:dTDP-4-dehydrorhamnose reductase